MCIRDRPNDRDTPQDPTAPHCCWCRWAERDAWCCAHDQRHESYAGGRHHHPRQSASRAGGAAPMSNRHSMHQAALKARRQIELKHPSVVRPGERMRDVELTNPEADEVGAKRHTLSLIHISEPTRLLSI